MRFFVCLARSIAAIKDLIWPFCGAPNAPVSLPASAFAALAPLVAFCAQAGSLAFDGDAACLHVLLVALQQQQKEALRTIFRYGCSVDSLWPSASYFAASSGNPFSSAREAGLSEGAPKGLTHLCVQQPSQGAAAAVDSSSSIRRASSAPRINGASFPAVLQPPRASTGNWGLFAEGWMFSKEFGKTEKIKRSQRQHALEQQLKRCPLLLVGEVGFLYSTFPAVHFLIAEETQQPGKASFLYTRFLGKVKRVLFLLCSGLALLHKCYQRAAGQAAAAAVV